jgi:hypothetical protein
MALVDDLRDKLKQNLIIAHSADDGLLTDLIRAALAYAEGYQHVPAGTYTDQNPPTADTERGIILLASHLYEARDGATGGFFADSVPAAEAAWEAARRLLVLGRVWSV